MPHAEVFRHGGLTQRASVLGPMTDDDEGRDPAITERYRRVLDKNLLATVLDQNVVIGLGGRVKVLIFSASDVRQCPAHDSCR